MSWWLFLKYIQFSSYTDRHQQVHLFIISLPRFTSPRQRNGLSLPHKYTWQVGGQVWNVKCDKANHLVNSACRLSLTGLLQHMDGWADARLWLAKHALPAGAPGLSTCHYCLLRFTSPWTPLGSICPSPAGFGINLALFKARAMDATIYQVIFGELGDLNCSLIDALQNTFLDNASLSLLSTDGKMELPPFFLVRYWKVFLLRLGTSQPFFS